MKRPPASLWILLLVLGFASLLKATLPQTVIGTWTPASSLTQARSSAPAVLLPDGRILVAGGENGSGPIASAEIFGTDGASMSAGTMKAARSRHFAAVLSDGRVLVGGGLTSGGGTTNTAEIYDPSDNSWSAINPLTQARANASVAVLQDGRVLIGGGESSSTPTNSVEIYDPTSGNFSFVGTLSSPRTQQAMTVLQDGRVLIVGGTDGTNPLASSDIFDPSSGNVTAGPNLATPRYGHSATTLLNGQVAVIGGAGSDGNGGTTDLASVELFDPTAGAFTTASAILTTAREGHQAFLLPKNNSVLIMGGTSNGVVVAASELFTPQALVTDGSWGYAMAATGSNITARNASGGAAMQEDGLLLAAGGNDASGNALASTELYAFPTVKTDKSDYPPGTTVNISGSGFNAGETVTITLVESPLFDTHGPYTVTANSNGNITDSSFTTDAHDVDIRFWLSAIGTKSGLIAQNTFTDANSPSLSVTATGPSGSGSVTSADTFISCAAAPGGNNSANCKHTYGGNFSTTLTATANSTFTFIGWTGNSPCNNTSSPTCAASQTGNSVFSVTATFAANQAPAITSANSTTFTVGSAGSFTVTDTGVPAPTLTESGTLPSGVTFSPSTGSLSGTPAAGAGGTYPITFTANNGIGSPASQNFTLTVDQAPAITSSNNTTFAVGTAGSFTVTATGFPAPTFTETGTLPSGVTLNSAGILSGSPGAGTGGSYAVTITASNGVTPSATQNFTLTVGQGPAITSANNITFKVGTAASFTVTATGFPAPTFTETGTLPSGVSLSTAGVLSGTPAAGTGGTYAIVITASNGTLPNSTQNFTLTVNQAPAITSANNTTFAVGTAGSFTVTATGFPAPTFTETGTLPSGVTLNSAGVLSGTPAAGSGGSYPIIITGSNGITPAATQSFTLNVNQSPAITSANNIAFAVGTAGSFTVTASGFPASTFTETGALPSGVTFSASGVLSGTPAAATGKAYPITITASNGISPSATQAFTLTVNQAPAITSANNASFVLNQAGTFTITVSGFPAPTFSETGALPTGVTLNPTTGTLSGTPTQTGNFAITITASNGVGTNSTQAFTLTVGQAPAITSADNTTFTVNSPGTFTITATGFPTPTLSETGTLPSGVTFNAGTGVLSGTPAIGTVGTYPITVKASNGVGTDATQSFTLTIGKATVTFTTLTASQSIAFGTASINLSGRVNGPPMLTGTVSITINGVTVSGIPLSGNPNNFSTAFSTAVIPSSPNAYTITYSYSGDANTTTATDTSTTLTVNKAATTFTNLASHAITFGTASVTLSGIISSANGFPTTGETVNITINNVTAPATIAASGAFSASIDTHAIPASATAYTITYNYAGDSNFNSATNTATTLTVNRGSTSTSLISSLNPSSFSQPVTFTATVSITTGIGVPTGTVQFMDGASALGSPVTLTNNGGTFSAQLQTSSLSAATHAITAVYSGDGNFTGSTSGTVSQVVNNPATTTSVVSLLNPSTFGQSVMFTATVTSLAGTPTGSVIFYDGACGVNPLAGPIGLDGSSKASFSTAGLSAGTHSISACYTHTGIFLDSNGSVSQQVNQATPTVTFTGSPASANFSSQFVVAATTNSTAAVTITASGACTISSTTVTMISGFGICSLRANWPADTNFIAATLTQSTNALPAPVTVTVPNTTVTYDGSPHAVTPSFSAAVNSFTVTYTGTSPTVYAASSAAPSEPGSYDVVATVTDPNYTGSGDGTLTINKEDPALNLVLLSGMPDQTSYGTRVFFELTTATSPCPTGQVDFFIDGDSTSSSTVPLSDSPCTHQPIEFSTPTLMPGTHNVTAVYSGDAHYLNQTSAPVSHIVVADTTTVTLATTATEVFVGDSVTLTATVTPDKSLDATAATPTGTVQFYDNVTTLLDQQPVVAKGSLFTATSVVSSLPAGPHSITATYVSANGDFVGSSSPVQLETVDKIAPTIHWQNPGDIVYGTKLSSAQLNATTTDEHNGGVPISGTFTYNPPVDSVLAIGSRNLSVTFTPADSATYTSQTMTVTVNVIAATLTVTADNAYRNYGADNPTFTFQYSGFVNNETSTIVTTSPTCSTTANSSSSIGTYDITCSGAVAPNYTVMYVSGKLTVKAAPLTITANSVNKIYGQALTFSGTEFSTSGLLNADSVSSVTLTSAGAAALATVTSPGPTYAITPGAAVGRGLGNYTITYVPGILTVNQAMLTLNLVGASGRYTAMPFTAACSVASGLVNGDTVTLAVTYASGGMPVTLPVNAGSYVATCTSSGNANYQTAMGQAEIMITPATVTVTATDQSMTFGGNAPTFTATYSGFQGNEGPSVLSGPTFTVYTDTTLNTAVTDFTTLKAGSYPIVASGASALNYTFQYVNGTLTVNKATFTGAVTTTAADPATVAYGQPLTAIVNLNTYSIGGVPLLQKHADPNDPTTQLPESLTVYLVSTGGNPSQAVKFGTATAVPTYDNTNHTSGTNKTGWTATITAAAPTPGNYTALVYGDDPGDQSLSGLNPSLADAGYFYPDTSDINYPILQSTQIDVVQASVTGSFTASDKVYDATTTATIATRSLTGVINQDDVNLTAGTATFSDKNVGNGKTVIGTGFMLSGAKAADYKLESRTLTTTARITPATVTGSFIASNKVYDATVAASIANRSLTGVLSGDSVSLSGGTATFSDKNVATAKTVTGTGFTLSGTDAGNYQLGSTTLTTSADIMALHVVASFTASNKTYDGTTAASVLTRTVVPIGGDHLYLSGGTASFSDKNVGMGKMVTLTGSTLTGADVANYVLDSVGTTTADITALHITGSFTASNKTYDGTTAASVLTRSLNSAIPGDMVSLSGGAASFTDKNVGVGKTVTLMGATLSGGDAGNYVLDAVSTAKADITALHITGSFTASNKTYDGTTAVSVLTRSLNSAIPGDMVSLSGGAASFTDKNVGVGKTVTLMGATLSGGDAGNYVLDAVSTAKADITALHVTGSFTASSKTYDGTKTAAVVTRSLNGTISGDTVSLFGGTASFADKNVGGGKIVTIMGATLSGGDAGNYALDSVSTANADITARPLTVTATGVDKVYDASTSAIVTLSDNRVSGDIFGDNYASAAFADKNVAMAKNVTVTGISISGTDAPNYTFNATASTTANITVKPASVTPYPGTKVYGSADPAFTGTLDGFVPADGVIATYSRTVGQTVLGSPYTISAILSPAGVLGNYTIAYNTATFTITAATLMVTASSGSTLYGAPVVVTAAYQGFVNGDGPGSLTPAPTCGPLFTVATPSATYVTSCAGASDPNYSIGYSSGMVTVTPAMTTTAVSASPNPSNWTQVVTFTATVVNSSGTNVQPVGSVYFYNAASTATCSTLLGSATIGIGALTAITDNSVTNYLNTSTATIATPLLPTGTDTILACYNYNPADMNYTGNFAASSSGAYSQTVVPAPIVTLVPTSLSFGTQAAGTKSGAQPITICNGPSAGACSFVPTATAALSISSIALSGNNPGDFIFTTSPASNCGGSIAVGGSCTVSVQFAPQSGSSGVESAFLNVTDNSANITGSVQSASVGGAGLSAIGPVAGSLSSDTIFATSNGCSAVTISGNGTVDSYNGATNGGNVGTNGNVSLSGNPVINGTVYSPFGTTGNCSGKSETGLSTSGKASATGGLQKLAGSVNYPLPPAPSSAVPTTNWNITSCPSGLTGCTNNGSKTVSLTPGQYGNLTISGGTTAHVTMGTYNVNSLTLSGNSILYVDSGPVIISLAGGSLSTSSAVLDSSGGSFVNPTGKTSNLQVYYAGSNAIKLSGGSGSYALVYAPNAAISISGGSHFYGSIVANTVNSSGNTAIHGDLSMASIAAGDTLWFSSSGLKVQGLPTSGSMKLYVTNASISFTANGSAYNVPVPNAVITFSSTASSASTTWDSANNRWSTLVPMSSINNNSTIHTFFDGVAFPVAATFPNGIQNVTWQAAYSTTSTGLSFNWQWGAAVYSALGSNNVLGTNALDTTDPAGTPEAYKSSLVFSDLGPGYVGMYEGTTSVVPTIAPASIAPSSWNFGTVSKSQPGSVTQSFTLSNNQSGTLTMSSSMNPPIVISGTSANDFSFTTNCPGSGGTMTGGSSCVINVTFTVNSTMGTLEKAKLYVYDDAANSPQTLFLEGIGAQ